MPDRSSKGFSGLLARAVIAAETISAVALGVLTALVCTSIILRYVFNSPIPDTFDLSRLLLGVAVFWGIAAACARDDHIRGDLLQSVLKPPLKNVINAFAQVCVIVFAALLAWKLWDKTWDVARTNQETSELRWRIWPFYLAAWSATILTLIGTLYQVWRAVRGAEGDFIAPQSEDQPESKI